MQEVEGGVLEQLLSILAERGLSGVIEALSQAHGREERLVLTALKRSLRALDEAPEQLPAQLYARLSQECSPRLRALLARCEASSHGVLFPLNQSLRHPHYPELMTLHGHKDEITALALMADGRHLLSASQDGSIIVWDLFKRRPLKQLHAQGGPLHAAALSHQQRIFAAGDEREAICLWDTKNWRLLKRFKGHTGEVRALAFVPPNDNRLLSVDASGKMCVWDVATGTLIKITQAHKRWCNAVAVSPDGRLAATSSTGNVLRLWELRTFEAVGDFCHFDSSPQPAHAGLAPTLQKENDSGIGHRLFPQALTFTPDNRQLVSAAEDLIVWDVESLSQQRRFGKSPWLFRALTFGPDENTLLTTSNRLQVWDFQRGEVRLTLHDRARKHNAIALSASGKTAFTGSNEHIIRAWSLNVSAQVLPPALHTQPITQLTISQDGTLGCSVASDASLCIWDLQTGTRLYHFTEHNSPFVMSSQFSAGSRRLLSAGERGDLRLWDLSTGMLLRTHQLDDYMVKGVCLSPDGNWGVIGGVEQPLILWDLETDQFHPLPEKKLHLCGMVISSDSRRLLTTSYTSETSGSLELWDLECRTKRYTRNLKEDYGRCVEWMAGEARAIIGSSGGPLYLWDVRKGRSLRRLTGHPSAIQKLRLVPPHLALTLDRQGTLLSWDLEQERCLGPLQHGYRDPIVDFDISPRTGRLAFVTPREVVLWDLFHARRLARFHGEGALTHCAISSTGNTLMAGEVLGQVHLLRYKHNQLQRSSTP